MVFDDRSLLHWEVLDKHIAFRAALLALVKVGINIETKMPITATTNNNSIRVNNFFINAPYTVVVNSLHTYNFIH